MIVVDLRTHFILPMNVSVHKIRDLHDLQDLCRSVYERQLSYLRTQQSRFAEGSETSVCCESPADSFL